MNSSIIQNSYADRIHIKIIKNIFDSIKHILLAIINAGFVLRYGADVLKHSWIIALLKQGKNSKYKESYRPVTLGPILRRINDNMSNRRTMNYLIALKLINPKHFGFIKGIGCMDACTYMMDIISNNFKIKNNKCFKNNYGITHGVYLDLTCAFDMVDHEILNIKIIEEYGMYGRMGDYFKEILKNRPNQVKINGYESEVMLYNIATPQGSPASSLLFIIYIDGVLAICIYYKNIIIILYADDISVLNNRLLNCDNKELSMYILQDVINFICWYIDSHRLKINPTKTQHIIFQKNTNNNKYEINIDINIKNEIIKKCDHVKYLGVLLDEELSGNYHIQHNIDVCYNMYYGIIKFIKNLYHCNAEMLPNIIDAVIYSKLLYGCELFNYNHTEMKKLFKFQNTLNRSIVNSNRNINSTSMHHINYNMDIKHMIQERKNTYFGRLLRLPTTNALSDRISYRWFHKWVKIKSLYDKHGNNWNKFKKQKKNRNIFKNINTYSPLYHIAISSLETGGGDIDFFDSLPSYKSIPKQTSFYLLPISNNEKINNINIINDKTPFDDKNYINSNNTKKELLIFTDGSCDEKGLGGAGIILIDNKIYKQKNNFNQKLDYFEHQWCEKNECECISLPISIRSSIEWCELEAINNALIKINSKYLNNHTIRIISDSIVSINWIIEKWYIKDLRIYKLVKQIRKQIIKYYKHNNNNTIIMQWVKSHNNTMGNELADKYAKNGVNIILNNINDLKKIKQFNKKFIVNKWQCTSAKMNKNVTKKNVLNHYKESFQQNIQNSSNDNLWKTFNIQFNKNLRSDLKHMNRKNSIILNRFRCNRIYLNYYMKHKMKISNSDLCMNCNENKQETSYHYIFECKAYDNIRLEFLNKLKDHYIFYCNVNDYKINTHNRILFKFLLFPPKNVTDRKQILDEFFIFIKTQKGLVLIY